MSPNFAPATRKVARLLSIVALAAGLNCWLVAGRFGSEIFAEEPRVAAASTKVESEPSLDSLTGSFQQGSWPYRPLERPAVPQTAEFATWVRGDVDRFIAAKFAEKNLRPAREADKRSLLRRVTFDLIGLPPTVAEQEAFLADTSPDAYEKLVDRLLASPRYGERWAQHWLDVVRYAETEGFKQDATRPDAHKYRDYVIRAFNDDVPFDRFVRQQLAGDELEPQNPDALIATGMIRLYPDEFNASNLVQRRQEILDDVTETATLAFMGLTVGCARCHDHKYDLISQEDYFRIQACFAAFLPADGTPAVGGAELEAYRRQQQTWEAATAEIRAEIDRELADERAEVREEAIAAYDADTLTALDTPEKNRTCLQRQLVAQAMKWVGPRMEKAYRRCDEKERKHYDDLMARLAEYDHLKPAPLPTALATLDAGRDAPPMHMLDGGDYRKPGREVQPGFLKFLGASEPHITPPPGRENSTGRRSALARWLTRGDHPLTARVFVNRLWQHHFGRGIVATPNDFGLMGGDPSHRELLDWLAADFVAGGWHVKRMQRMMVLSATYRQSSILDAQPASGLSNDSENVFLAHARRRRLEGEALRDAMLVLSGQLNLRMFGTSARPMLPPDVSARYSWEADPVEADRHRRSIYVFAKRNMRFPLFEAFDQPDMHGSCPRRTATTTAPQALELLNGDIASEAARQWCARLVTAGSRQRAADNGWKYLINTAYLEAFGRAAKNGEIAAAERFIAEQTNAMRELADGKPLEPLSPAFPADFEHATAAALVDFCHALVNSNEFLYID